MTLNRSARPMPCRLAALALLLPMHAAFAQTPGTYVGQNAQGYAMQVVVARATNGIGTEVRTIQSTQQLQCEQSGTPVWVGSVVSGYFPIDAAGAFDAAYLWDRDEFRTTGQFAGDGSVAGQTHWTIAAVGRREPHAAEICASPSLAWSASQVLANGAAPAAAATPPKLDFVIERVLDRAGRVVRDTVRSAR
jgi:hypothetical protein